MRERERERERERKKKMMPNMSFLPTTVQQDNTCST